jgi:hypothetical protein
MSNQKISTEKTKNMEFKGKFHVRNKITIDNNKLDQTSHLI